MAFQPIVDIRSGLPFAYEALVRGPNGEGAGWVLGQVTDANRYAFDQRCRVTAIETAVAAGLLETSAKLSINFLPNAIYDPKACMMVTIKAAKRVGLPLGRIIFELTESENVTDVAFIERIIDTYSAMGVHVALDDFGAGFSGLFRLTKFDSEIVKIDMDLIRDCDTHVRKRKVLTATAHLCAELGLTVIGEGVETAAEAAVLSEIGIHLQQGYYFAKPALNTLPFLSAFTAKPLARAA